jgi:hypothetical protein
MEALLSYLLGPWAFDDVGVQDFLPTQLTLKLSATIVKNLRDSSPVVCAVFLDSLLQQVVLYIAALAY